MTDFPRFPLFPLSLIMCTVYDQATEQEVTRMVGWCTRSSVDGVLLALRHRSEAGLAARSATQRQLDPKGEHFPGYPQFTHRTVAHVSEAAGPLVDPGPTQSPEDHEPGPKELNRAYVVIVSAPGPPVPLRGAPRCGPAGELVGTHWSGDPITVGPGKWLMVTTRKCAENEMPDFFWKREGASSK